MSRFLDILRLAGKAAVERGLKAGSSDYLSFTEGAMWMWSMHGREWVKAGDRLPREERKEDGTRKFYSPTVFVRYERKWKGQSAPSVYYGTAFVFYSGEKPVWSSYNKQENECTERITHWMYIHDPEKQED